MKLSSLADYAVVMMSAAARHCGVSGRLNATVLAEETGVPLPTAQKLVSRLSAAGLIESMRGTGGGFRLARPPSAITLADIVEAVEGPIAGNGCADAGEVKPHLTIVSGAVRGALAGVSLASLSSVRPEPVEGPSFLRSDEKSGASTSSARTVLGAVN